MKKAIAKGEPEVDVGPGDFVAEAPISADAKPVDVIPPGSDPKRSQQALAAKQAGKQAKAAAKALRAAHTGLVETLLVKSLKDKPVVAAEIKLVGVTLGEFERLLESKLLTFAPKGK